MALLHRATLTPSKLELIGDWLRAQEWFEGAPDAPDAELAQVAAFRFDDPLGEVGVETLLISAGEGPVLQVPLTYRDAPFEPAREWLIGTLEHSVLGRRWVYDGTGDPVYLQTVAAATLGGGVQADLNVEVDGELVQREPTARVHGTGAEPSASAIALPDQVTTQDDESTTIVTTESLLFGIERRPEARAAGTEGGSVLLGSWGDLTDVPLVAVAHLGG